MESETITINKEELKEILDILLDIAETNYNEYHRSDDIMRCNDFYKKYLD